MSSLINIARTKFLDAIHAVQPPGRWKILVVDEHSRRILYTVLKQFDILEENVTQIELITDHREPQGMEAMYILMSTNQNVDRIVRDFSSREPRYTAAHVFFLDPLPEPLFQRLFASPAEPFLQKVEELFINFWAIEAQVFSMRSPSLFFSMFSPPRGDAAYRAAKTRVMEDIHFTGKIITNVCISLNEYPYVRYLFAQGHAPLGPLRPNANTRPPPPSEGSARWRTNLARGAEARAYESVEGDHITKLIAFAVQRNLDEYKKQNPSFPKESPRPRGTLFITDRTMDMVAPFLHEFTYQAMANDLLPIEDGTKYRYKFQSSNGVFEDKVAELSDIDNVWTDVRHMHMKDTIDKLMSDFNKFLSEHAVFNGEGAANLNDMKDMLANLPQYQEQREKFSLHLNMAEQCMGIFEKDKLPVVANVEQECATGLTAEGKTPKKLVEEMVPILDSRDVVNINKVRIIALYIMHREGVPEEDKRRLYQHARLSRTESEAVDALALLGVNLVKGGRSRPKLKPKSLDESFELSRYLPLLRTMVEDHLSGKLDQQLFPYVKEAPNAAATAPSLRPQPQQTSLRSAKPLRSATPGYLNKNKKVGVSNETQQRVIVFVAGGMTYSEMREAYEMSKSLNKDVIIGSTHVITPKQFVDDLKVLELGGVGSKAMPNGLPDNRSGPPTERPYQEFYDMKYYTKDAPPPQQQPPRLNVPAGRDAPRPSPRPSPSPSYNGSSHSNNSSFSGMGIPSDKKKKKGGLFKF